MKTGRVRALILCGVLFAVTTCGKARAAGGSGAFDAANKLYERGQYRDAAAAYQSLAQSGHASAALFFNLGNAFYKAGEIGRAMDAYRKSERLDPRDPDLRANLQFVRNRIPGPTLAPNRWQAWLRRLTLNEWTALAATAMWLWLGLLVLRQLRPSWKSPLRTATWLSGAATLCFCLCLAAALLVASGATAIVVAQEAVVRNGPLEESQSAFTVHDGAELSVLDRKGDWVQVSVGVRRVGWVKRDQMTLRGGGA